MDDRVRIISTNEEFKIVADPFRLKIIDTYVDQGTPLTVKMVADLIGEVPAKVHYHVQKLLKIEILALDHIEVINGINAKYYILLKDSFKFDVNENASDKLKSFQIDSTINLLMRTVDAFKTDIVNLGERAKVRGNIPEDAGSLSKRNLYLSSDDKEVLFKFIRGFVDEHSKPNEDKNKYVLLSGLMKKVE